MKQEPPFAVQVEMSEGCNLRCAFCGINGIRGKERTYKFMTLSTAERIATAIAEEGWNPRIEFAMHGEPTMNPKAAKIIAIFRKALPKVSILMLSNGGGVVKDPLATLDSYFRAGLNTFGLDQYQQVNYAEKILDTLGYGVPWDRVNGGNPWAYPVAFHVYPDDPSGNPHARQAPSKRRLVHIRPIDAQTEGTHATLNNHAGAGAPKNDSGMGKPCAKPFRELSFRWDGNVAICCNDWRGELRCGNINNVSLNEIWNGKPMREARKRLIKGLRDFGPCEGCDATSYRVGLLPDKLGKQVLPKPTPEGLRYLTNHCSATPLTKPVKREWE